MEKKMGNKQFLEHVKPQLDNGRFLFSHVMPDSKNQYHDGTNSSNEIGVIRLSTGELVIQKVMLTSHKYNQRRKALTEMVHAWLDEGIGGQRVVPLTYAESFTENDHYLAKWGEPKVEGRRRVCQVVHEYLEAGPGDEWRGEVYRRLGNLTEADLFCKATISSHPDAERIALLDFLTINQDRSARNWLTDKVNRFYAIDNGMAWFHEFPHSDDWKIGTVIDDVLLQVGEWQFISGVFTTCYAGSPLSKNLLTALVRFDWQEFCSNIDQSCISLGLPKLSEDWRFLGINRRLHWIIGNERFPSADEYRGWLKGSELMTPNEIVASGGKLVWQGDSDGI